MFTYDDVSEPESLQVFQKGTPLGEHYYSTSGKLHRTGNHPLLPERIYPKVDNLAGYALSRIFVLKSNHANHYY
eukprot:1161696-Pelagomonas_calceolata.AAC.7